MAWVAVDRIGREGIFDRKPVRDLNSWTDASYVFNDSEICLPRGSIKKLIGRDLTWEDEPVELKEEQL